MVILRLQRRPRSITEAQASTETKDYPVKAPNPRLSVRHPFWDMVVMSQVTFRGAALYGLWDGLYLSLGAQGLIWILL